MLVHYVNHWTWMDAIPFAVLGASFLGSGHCVAMCGGLIAVAAQNWRAMLSYQIGRLLGYSALGALAGTLGAAVFQKSIFVLVPWISTILLSIGFVIFGIRIWKGQSLHLFRMPAHFWNKTGRMGPGLTGLFSAFLPCGWLHVFLLGAIATQNSWKGAIYLFFFWLGTLPATSFASALFAKVLTPITSRVPKLSAVILISIGIGTLSVKMGFVNHLKHENSKQNHLEHKHCHDGPMNISDPV